MSDYSRIIDHPHHQSKTRPHMPMIKRAAQFSPFAALTGYDDSVEEARRLTDMRPTLDDDAIEAINRKLNEITADTNICVTYFIEDLLKEGGNYQIISGTVKKIDTTDGRLIMNDGTIVPIGDIFDIDILDATD